MADDASSAPPAPTSASKQHRSFFFRVLLFFYVFASNHRKKLFFLGLPSAALAFYLFRLYKRYVRPVLRLLRSDKPPDPEDLEHVMQAFLGGGGAADANSSSEGNSPDDDLLVRSLLQGSMGPNYAQQDGGSAGASGSAAAGGAFGVLGSLFGGLTGSSANGPDSRLRHCTSDRSHDPDARLRAELVLEFNRKQQLSDAAIASNLPVMRNELFQCFTEQLTSISSTLRQQSEGSAERQITFHRLQQACFSKLVTSLVSVQLVFLLHRVSVCLVLRRMWLGDVGGAVGGGGKRGVLLKMMREAEQAGENGGDAAVKRRPEESEGSTTESRSLADKIFDRGAMALDWLEDWLVGATSGTASGEGGSVLPSTIPSQAEPPLNEAAEKSGGAGQLQLASSNKAGGDEWANEFLQQLQKVEDKAGVLDVAPAAVVKTEVEPVPLPLSDAAMKCFLTSTIWLQKQENLLHVAEALDDSVEKCYSDFLRLRQKAVAGDDTGTCASPSENTRADANGSDTASPSAAAAAGSLNTTSGRSFLSVTADVAAADLRSLFVDSVVQALEPLSANKLYAEWLVPDGNREQVLARLSHAEAEAGATVTVTPAEETAQVEHLLDEQRDVVESPQFAAAAEFCIRRALERLYETLELYIEENGTSEQEQNLEKEQESNTHKRTAVVPVGKLIPFLCQQAELVFDPELEENPFLALEDDGGGGFGGVEGRETVDVAQALCRGVAGIAGI
eukprot:g8829.t1